MRKLAVLGSTGSIGVTTLGIVERFPDRFEVVALAAGRRIDRLAEQMRRFRPRLVAVADAEAADGLRERIGPTASEILHGEEGRVAVATAAGVDLLVSGLVGAMGLRPTLAAIRLGRDVALANKEVMVVAGELVTRTARECQATLFPIDSEHNAIFQALQGHRRDDVRRLVLTASGGPFREHTVDELRVVTRDEALRHPTWQMGDKITIDSATLMNKGLEVIEARWLFDLPPERIGVVVHPQSVVHSMVEYVDGSILAQLGIADMSIPIAYVLAWPERLPLDDLPRLDLPALRELTFFEPDLEKFPCLRLAYEALAAGGTTTAALNAANEVAVARFLEGEIPFLAIADVLGRVLEQHENGAAGSLEACLEADRRARELATRILDEQRLQRTSA